MKITKTKSGTWTARIAIKDADGNYHWKRFTGKTKEEVRDAISMYQVTTKVYKESKTLGDCMQRYLDKKAKTLSPSTMHGYLSSQRTFKSSYTAFLNTQIDRLTAQDIQMVVDSMKREKCSAKTVKNRIGLISAVMTAEGLRMPRVALPSVTVTDPVLPDEEMVKQISKAASGTRMELPFALAILGLRRGEICAVTAEDLDGNTLHISRAVAVDDDGYTHVKTPKTARSDRHIVLPDSVADLLRKQGKAWEKNPNALTKAFPHLLNKAKIPQSQQFRLHDCRHFFASYCHDVLKLSDEQIMKLGGWSTDSVLKRRYRRAIMDVSQDVADSFGKMIG